MLNAQTLKDHITAPAKMVSMETGRIVQVRNVFQISACCMGEISKYYIVRITSSVRYLLTKLSAQVFKELLVS